MKIIEMAFMGYPVTDLKRACRFYSETLGLMESRRWGDEEKAWVEYDIGSGTLAITNMPEDWKPSADGGGVGLEVDDFEAAVAQLKQAGVKFQFEPMATPVCHMAAIFDPDGNSLVIHKRKSG
jgi:catechol 2,3-dioxygenase-like lactoylglutathione lyase family enzyme